MIQSEKKKPVRQAVFRWLLLAVLILAAAWLWRQEGQNEPVQEQLPAVTPVPTAHNDERLRRETAYERDTAALQALLESGAADEATQEMAAQKLSVLIAEHQNEIGLENALQEAGFASAVVLVQNGAVTVMIPQEMLNEEASAQILALCVAHTDAGPENVRVMALR